MTIIDELLILLDDLTEAAAEDIPDYFAGEPNRQVIFSSLGRLVSRGWVIKRNRKQKILYSISRYGVDQLNQTLDAIKKEVRADWDGVWRLIIFDIPESKRKLRDQFRLLLKSEGFGLLKSSVWLSAWDKWAAIAHYIKRHQLTDHITQLETARMAESYQSIILAQQSWDWPMIEDGYRRFLQQAEKQYSQLVHKNHRTRFKAKKLVFQYAEAVKQDPVLPTGIAPNASLARRARAYYGKIRPYCLPD